MDLHIPGRKSIVIAFEDDTSAMGDTRAFVRLAPLVEDIFAQDGFHVKVTKSTITGSDIETIAIIDPLPNGFRLSTQGTTMLGVSIGNREYRRQMCDKQRYYLDLAKSRRRIGSIAVQECLYQLSILCN